LRALPSPAFTVFPEEVLMPILNEGVSFDSLPADNRQAFNGKGIPRLFPAGWQLYKFTKHPLSSLMSPWWSSVEPLDTGDPGLKVSLERAARLAVTPQQLARVRSAVTQQWNSMDNLLRIKLTRPVYGFVGRCSSQRVDQDVSPKVVFIGGAWQVFIPGLARADVMPG
jgi:hypothetical protein